MQLNKDDLELIKIAEETVKANKKLYKKINLVVASAVRCKNGNIYKGINILTSHSICGEQVAIGQAFANGEREFDTIVAVKLNPDGSSRIVSPCGLCRYTFEKLNLDMNVIVVDEKKNKTIKVHMTELLPYPYHRDMPKEEEK